MANDVKAYLQKLAQESGLDADAQSALLKAVENEKFAGSLNDSIAMRSDYSRNMDDLKKQRAEFDKNKEEWSAWYKKAIADDAAREAELQNFRQRFGVINDGSQPAPSAFDQQAFEKRILEEADKRIRAAQQVNITITKEATKAASDYYARFGKPLDVDGLEKFAIESNLPLRTAYEQFIAAEVRAKDEAATAERIKREVDEKVKAELSKHNLPTDPVEHEPHVFFDRATFKPDQSRPDERTQLNAFREAWNNPHPARP